MGFELRARRLAVAGLALVSAGCVTPRIGPPPLLRIADRHCTPHPNFAAASTIAYDTSRRRGEADTRITASSACFADRAGPSLYAVYRLPSLPVAYLIRVASMPEGAALLAPRVLLYGPDGTLKRRLSGRRVVFRGDALSVIFRSHIEERYLVVASDPTVIGHQISRIEDTVQGGAAYVYPYVVAVNTGADVTVNNVLSYNGRITVSLRTLSAR